MPGTRRLPVQVALGVDEYTLMCGRSRETTGYGDPCIIKHGNWTYLALIHETSDGKRISLLGDDLVVEIKNAAYDVVGSYDEHQRESPTSLLRSGSDSTSKETTDKPKQGKEGKKKMATKVTIESDKEVKEPLDGEEDDSGIEIGEEAGDDDSDDSEDDDDSEDWDDEDEDWDDDWDEDEDEDEDEDDSDDSDSDEDEDE